MRSWYLFPYFVCLLANELPGYHGEGYPSGYGGAPPSVSHAEAGYMQKQDMQAIHSML